MTPLRWALLTFAGLCVLGIASAWSLHWHTASRAVRKAGRHTWDYVHRQVRR